MVRGLYPYQSGAFYISNVLPSLKNSQQKNNTLKKRSYSLVFNVRTNDTIQILALDPIYAAVNDSIQSGYGKYLLRF